MYIFAIEYMHLFSYSYSYLVCNLDWGVGVYYLSPVCYYTYYIYHWTCTTSYFSTQNKLIVDTTSTTLDAENVQQPLMGGGGGETWIREDIIDFLSPYEPLMKHPGYIMSVLLSAQSMQKTMWDGEGEGNPRVPTFCVNPTWDRTLLVTPHVQSLAG